MGSTSTSGATACISADSRTLSHAEAEALCERIVSREASGRTIVLDLKETEEASTAAFARLVLLRRDLLRKGSDLRLSGLRNRAESMWRISRLSEVLPLQ